MKLTREFLTVLQQRLKVGNRRGVHLNAIPARSRFKFDLNKLSVINDELPTEFLNELLSNSKFNFEINFKGVDFNLMNDKEKVSLSDVAKRLNSLEHEVKDIELENGINTFGFGYPLLVRRDLKDNKITVAPLFIWSLRLTRPKEKNTWRIKRTEDDPIILNEVLINHLESDAAIKLDQIADEFLEDSLIDKEELIDLCMNVIEKMNDTVTDEHLRAFKSNSNTISRIPEKQTLEGQTNQIAYIHWGGLFSIFKTQKESIIKQFDNLLSLEGSEIENGEIDNKSFQTISSIETDPSQQGVLTALKSERNMVIHGPPGTGKSQTLTAVITNALENGKRILVVCEKRTALEVIHENLKDKGIDPLSVIVKDVKTDRRSIVNRVRSKVDERNYNNANENFIRSSLHSGIAKCRQFIDKVNSCHKFLGRNILDGRNWTTVVGMYLKKGKTTSDRNIDLTVDLRRLEFSFDEYLEINNILTDAETKYRKARHIIRGGILNPMKFKGDNPFVVEDELKKSLLDYKRKLSESEKLKQSSEEAARQMILGEYKKEYSKINISIERINATFERYYTSPAFLDLKKTNGVLFKIATVFSKKKKDLILAQQKCLKDFQLVYKFTKLELNKHYKPNLVSDLSKMPEEIDRMEKALSNWKSTWNELIEKEMNSSRKGSVTFSELEASRALKNFNNNFFQKVKSDGWFNEEWPSGNIGQDFFVNLDSKISTALGYLEEGQFIDIYQWYNLLERQKNVVEEIINQLKGEVDWSKSFSLFYLNELLKRNGVGEHRVLESEYQQMDAEIKQIDKYQSQYILAQWGSRQQQAVIEFNTGRELQVKNLYNKRSSHVHKRHSLRMIIKKDFELFSSFFPVVLTTPTTACTMFSSTSTKDLFDIVIFDEASQLRVEETLPAFLMGKQKIVAGDEHQMPPSNYFATVFEGDIDDDEIEEEEEMDKIQMANSLLGSKSLLELSMDLSFTSQYLDFHYRSKHPYLIDFSNAAFYSGRLCPMPSKYSYRPIQLIQVDGTFNSGINEREAVQVLSILEKGIQRNELGLYPTVGIATFNIKQRNLILDKIAERCAEPINKAFALKVTELEQNGFFVKNLENIQGDERDIIILSTTYGREKNGKFARRFGPINHSKGYKLLNVIVTRAKFKVFVCTSIPISVYSNYKEVLKTVGSNNKSAAFFAYLAYAKAVSEGDDLSRDAVLDALAEYSEGIKEKDYNTGLGHTESPFEEEVYQYLLGKYKEDEIILQYKHAGFRIDMVYKSENENTPLIAIECDGAKFHSSPEAYLHDIYRQKILEESGFVFFRIWSTDWWRNSDREFKKLVDFVSKIEENPPSNKTRGKITLSHLPDEAVVNQSKLDVGIQMPMPFESLNSNVVLDGNLDSSEVGTVQLLNAVTIGSRLVLKRMSAEVEVEIQIADEKGDFASMDDELLTLNRDHELVKSFTGKKEGDSVSVVLPGKRDKLFYSIKRVIN